MDDTDLVVIGGGIVGLMTAYYASRQGKKVVLFERYFCGTQEGSSAEHVRMWRTMYTELNHSKLAYESGDLFREIERESQSTLMVQRGLLNFGVETEYTPEGTLLSPIKTMEQLGKRYLVLTRDEIHDRYPFKNLPDNYIGIFQEDNAVIDVKKSISITLSLCLRHGVKVRQDTAAMGVRNYPEGVVVDTSKGEVRAKKLVIAAGPFTNQILRTSFDQELDLLIWDMCFSYYRLNDPARQYPMWFQFDVAKNGYSNLFYGFPNVEFGRKDFIRVAVDWASHTFHDVDKREYVPRRLDIKLTQEFVQDHMVGVDKAPIDAGTALMAHLPDNLSVLDYLPSDIPNNKNVVVCCAGWAFKFAPLFGKLCANLAFEQKVAHDINEFSIERPRVLKRV